MREIGNRRAQEVESFGGTLEEMGKKTKKIAV